MSDRYTSIKLPGMSGIADHGRRPRAEMIELIRRHAEREKAEAEAILAATDDQFQIETYVGVHVRKGREVIQKSSIQRLEK